MPARLGLFDAVFDSLADQDQTQSIACPNERTGSIASGGRESGSWAMFMLAEIRWLWGASCNRETHLSRAGRTKNEQNHFPLESSGGHSLPVSAPNPSFVRKAEARQYSG